MEKKQRKMKSTVFVRPRKAKEWVIFALMVASVLAVISPMINVFNTGALVGGFPIFLLLAVGTLLVVLIVVNIANKWGVK